MTPSVDSAAGCFDFLSFLRRESFWLFNFDFDIKHKFIQAYFLSPRAARLVACSTSLLCSIFSCDQFTMLRLSLYAKLTKSMSQHSTTVLTQSQALICFAIRLERRVLSSQSHWRLLRSSIKLCRATTNITIIITAIMIGESYQTRAALNLQPRKPKASSA